MAEGRLLTNSLLSTTPSQTISTSFQAQEKQAPIPPPGRTWGQNKGRRRHPTETYRLKCTPAWMQSSLKITHTSEKDTEKKQSSDVLNGSKFASCGLGGLHRASHAWDQQVMQQMSQGSKHKPEAQNTNRTSEPLRPEPITQEGRMGYKLSCHVNFPPESVPTLS